MTSIDHVNLRIPEREVEKALEFYGEFLGLETWKLEEYRKGERTSFFFRIGEEALLNIRPKEDFERPSGKNFDHFCILKDESIEDLKDRALGKGFEVLRENEPLGAKGRAPAIYVEDPFGYMIEVKEAREN